MLLLLDSGLSLVTPDLGLIFWTTLIFLTLWFLLGKYAFTPIKNALKERENSIAEALNKADEARKEMANLQAQNEK